MSDTNTALNIPKIFYCTLLLAVLMLSGGAALATVSGLVASGLFGETTLIYEECSNYQDRRDVCVPLDEPREVIRGEGLLYIAGFATFILTLTPSVHYWHRGYLRWFDDGPLPETEWPLRRIVMIPIDVVRFALSYTLSMAFLFALIVAVGFVVLELIPKLLP